MSAGSTSVAEAVAYLRARGEDEAVGTIDTRWAYKRSADYIESALSPQPVALGELSDALLIVDGYDFMEGDVVPERELWTVVNAARKVLEGAPQPVVDREALTEVAAKAIHRWDKKPVVWDHLDSEERSQYRSEAERVVDAMLALLNGRQS